MRKRQFLKTLSLGTLAAPLYSSALIDLLESTPELEIKEIVGNEDFWMKIRRDYKLKPEYINLESGYYNIIPTPTLNAMIDHARKINYEGSYYMRTIQWENKARMAEKLADVAGCRSENLIITRNTTESLDMVIKGQDWKPGDQAVMAAQDYGAMRDMFRQVSDRFGIDIIEVSVPNHPESDEEIVELYADALGPNTKLLMVCHMINITGQILPVKKICDMAHDKGVKVMVDGAHCIGHFQFRIEDLNCDYYGSSLHKWLAVPLGTGLLYVRDEHIDTLWPLLAESRREPGDISRLNHTGTHPVYHDLSIENAIDYLNLLGAERKENRLRYLQTYWTSVVREHPKIILNTPSDPQRACGIANVGVEGVPPADLARQLLEDYGIFTVAIDSANVKGCRITPNVFTLTSELDKLVSALKEIAG